MMNNEERPIHQNIEYSDELIWSLQEERGVTEEALELISKRDSNYYTLEKYSLKEGVFGVKIGTAKIDCFYKSSSTQYLYVFLRAWKGSRGPQYGFQRWSWFNVVSGNVLSINNPMLYNCKDLNAGWYLGFPNEDYTMYISMLIEDVANKLGIVNEHIIIYGSSAAGTAAIHIGQHIKKSVVVSLNGQFLPNPPDYLKKDFKKTGYDLSSYSNIDTEKIILNSDFQLLLIANLRSKADLDPLINLSKQLGIQLSKISIYNFHIPYI